MFDDRTDGGQLTFEPTDDEHTWIHKPNHRLKQIDEEAAEQISMELELRHPFPRIRPDPLVYEPSQDDVLYRHIGLPNGRNITLLSMEQRCRIPADASFRHMRFTASDRGASALIRRQPSGHVVIWVDPDLRRRLIPVHTMLLKEELRLHRHYRDGFYTADMWRLDEKRGLILNGDFSPENAKFRPAFQPTRIVDMAQIRNMVTLILDPRAFEKNRAHDCRRGICHSTVHDTCTYYLKNLPQCDSPKAKQRAAQPRREHTA